MDNTTTAGVLDKILGEKGIKTDIQVSLKPNTYFYLITSIALGATIGVALGFFVKGLFK